MKHIKVNTDCRYFKGDLPCKPHKLEGIHCENCGHYAPLNERILIIKLGAIGDVIRTTPLLRALQMKHSEAQITWLTYSPDILPAEQIDNILSVNTESIAWLKANKFDWLINLDKDPLAITLAKEIQADKKSGFTMDHWGRCIPMGEESEIHKWQTGLWDDENKNNKLNYMEEIFLICGMVFNGEEYILEDKMSGQIQWNLDESKKQIGLNTGCGGRWTSRLWPVEYWIELAKDLIKDGHEVVLLGGKQEDEKNKTVAKESGARYLGHYDLPTFTNLVNHMDIIVTAVTMAMHLAIGLRKNLILFNNIFNRNEFYLYERGVILEPEMDCDCYFSPTCPNNCMETLHIHTVYQAVKSFI